MTITKLAKSHPTIFFVLIYAISAPFWIIGAHARNSWLPDNIPLTDLGAALSPAIAACLLIYRENGWVGLKTFLARVFDHRRISSRGWFITAMAVLPFLYVLTYLAMRAMGFPLPAQLHASPALIGTFVVFLIAAAVEELGYSAYATDSLQARHSALVTALLIGIPWALWHLPSMLQMGQGWTLVAWGLLGTVAFRVITVWLYNNNNGSLSVVILAHAIATTARSAFPGGRGAYELGDGSIGYAIIIATAVLVTLAWGPKRLTRFSGRRSSTG